MPGNRWSWAAASASRDAAAATYERDHPAAVAVLTAPVSPSRELVHVPRATSRALAPRVDGDTITIILLQGIVGLGAYGDVLTVVQNAEIDALFAIGWAALYTGQTLGGSVTVAVSTGPQTLTAGQQAQARANIDAAASTGAVTLPAPSGTAATDDANLSAAITQAAALAPCTIRAQRGTYQLTTAHVFPVGVNLVGEGGGNTSHSTGNPNAATIFEATTSAVQMQFAAEGAKSSGFRIDGNGVAVTPFKRYGGASRIFEDMVVSSNARTGVGNTYGSTNDLALFWGSQNDTYVNCGFADSDRDLRSFDLGFGGARFINCEVINCGRDSDHFDTLQTGPYQVYGEPTDIVFYGDRLEGAAGRSNVYVNHGELLHYVKNQFASPAPSAANIYVADGTFIRFTDPTIQQTPVGGSYRAGSVGLYVGGFSTVTLDGQVIVAYLNSKYQLDGFGGRISDLSASGYSGSIGVVFSTLNGATGLQISNGQLGVIHAEYGSAGTVTEIGYNAPGNAYQWLRLGDGTVRLYPGVNLSDPPTFQGKPDVGRWRATGAGRWQIVNDLALPVAGGFSTNGLNGYQTFQPVDVTVGRTLDRWGVKLGTVGVGGVQTVAVAYYAADPNTGLPTGSPVYTLGAALDLTTGTANTRSEHTLTSPLSIAPGRYWISCLFTVTGSPTTSATVFYLNGHDPRITYTGIDAAAASSSLYATGQTAFGVVPALQANSYFAPVIVERQTS